jgi:hypothetical protein
MVVIVHCMPPAGRRGCTTGQRAASTTTTTQIVVMTRDGINEIGGTAVDAGAARARM